MSGTVSYELFISKVGSNNSGFTPEGGIFETFINNTGLSRKGTIVVASTSVNNGVDIAPPNSEMPIGVIYESNINPGALVKVIVSGKAEVLLKDGGASFNGFWCGVSDVQGRMYQQPSPPINEEYYRVIGHSLEFKSSSDPNRLSLVQLHFL